MEQYLVLGQDVKDVAERLDMLFDDCRYFLYKRTGET